MKITKTQTGYRLEAETSIDMDFVGDLDLFRMANAVGTGDRQLSNDSTWRLTSVNVSIPQSKHEFLNAILQLGRLLQIDAHRDGAVCSNAAEPDAQADAFAIVKQVNCMLDSSIEPVCGDETTRQKVGVSHD